MLLTLTTTREPATDLGYLLVKHPDRVHRVEVPSGTATVCFPEAGPRRCTAALILDVDVRSPQRNGSRNGTRNGNGNGDGFALARYVNDRPYAASSLLASALNRVFRSAMRGSNRDRPELAATPIPLEVRIPVLRCRGGAGVLDRLFAPLGWTVQAAPIPLDDEHPEWGASRYLDVTVSATLRLADALNHLYILLPVLDDAKHYWVGPDEIDKLLRAGEGWLATHPSRELIADRYLVHRRGLAADAIRAIDSAAAQRLAEVDDVAVPDTVDANLEDAVDEDADLPSGANAAPLAHQRRDAVLAALAETGSARILDLGCGTGALLQHLVTVKAYTEIVGTDVSTRALEVAERRLRLNQRPGRVRLLQSALTYTDDRLVGFDAAVLMEVIEHIDPPRLPAVVASVFGHARPSTVVVTTPNVEHNVRYPGSPRRRAR